MSHKHSNRITLSKSILDMKFMKKTKEKIEKQTYIEEGEKYFATQQQLPQKAGRYIVEPSYVFCEQLIEGRLSFRGENPELERLIELEQIENNPKVESTMETDVSDSQMAETWRSTTKINVINIENKRQKFNHNEQEEPKRKRPKFLKPKD